MCNYRSTKTFVSQSTVTNRAKARYSKKCQKIFTWIQLPFLERFCDKICTEKKLHKSKYYVVSNFETSRVKKLKFLSKLSSMTHEHIILTKFQLSYLPVSELDATKYLGMCHFFCTDRSRIIRCRRRPYQPTRKKKVATKFLA